MVYQEDVIKIAQYFGGLTHADGDILRRAMSGKERSIEKLNEVKANFFKSCQEQGILKRLLLRLFVRLSLLQGILSVKHIQLHMRWKATKVFI